jgi:hypothetical protein
MKISHLSNIFSPLHPFWYWSFRRRPKAAKVINYLAQEIQIPGRFAMTIRKTAPFVYHSHMP